MGGKTKSVEAIRMFEEDAKMKAERQEYAVCLAEYNERTNQNEFELGAVIERFWFAPGPGGTMAGTKPLASATIVGMRQFDGDSNEILPEPQVVYDIGSGPRLFVSFARMREIIRAGLAKVTSRTLYTLCLFICPICAYNRIYTIAYAGSVSGGDCNSAGANNSPDHGWQATAHIDRS